MRNLILLLTLICFLFQSNTIVAQLDSGIKKGLSNSLSADIENVSRKDAERVWKNIVKQYDGKTKKGKNDEWYTEKVKVPQIGEEGTVKMYMSIKEKDRLARTTFLVSKNGDFINFGDNPSEAEEVELIFQSFIYELKKKSFENETKDEEKNLKSLNKDLEKLEKDNKKYHEEIEKCKKKIAEMESKIAKNEDDQMTKKEEVTMQKEVVEEVIKKANKHRKS